MNAEILTLDISARVRVVVPPDASDRDLLRAVREELASGERVELDVTHDDVTDRVEL